MANIQIRDLVKTFSQAGTSLQVLNDLTLEIDEAKITVLVGPSGCGKSTLLNILAGIEHATSGEIDFGAEGNDAKVGYVFQDARLLPWKTVLDNVLFVLRDQGSKETQEAIARKYLKMVGLENVLEKFPYQLSGGMQQRVGIARALAIEPDVLLMDEPFSHLDAITAEHMREQVVDIWEQSRKTIIFVTHDIQEGVELAHTLLMMAKGGDIKENIHIDLSRPRDFGDEDVALLYANVVRKFRAMQNGVEQSRLQAVSAG